MSGMQGVVERTPCRSTRGCNRANWVKTGSKSARASSRNCELVSWVQAGTVGFRAVRTRRKGETVGVLAIADGIGDDLQEGFRVTGINGEVKTYQAVTPWVAARDYVKEVFTDDCRVICSENGAEPKRIKVQSPSGAIAEYEIAVKVQASVEVNLISSTGAGT